MVGVRGWGAGRGPGRAGLWTGEVIIHWVFPRGTHDLRREPEKNMKSLLHVQNTALYQDGGAEDEAAAQLALLSSCLCSTFCFQLVF